MQACNGHGGDPCGSYRGRCWVAAASDLEVWFQVKPCHIFRCIPLIVVYVVKDLYERPERSVVHLRSMAVEATVASGRNEDVSIKVQLVEMAIPYCLLSKARLLGPLGIDASLCVVLLHSSVRLCYGICG